MLNQGNAPYACKVECCRLNCSLKNEAKKECDIQMENENPDESQVAGIAAGFHQSTKNNPWTTLLSITTVIRLLCILNFIDICLSHNIWKNNEVLKWKLAFLFKS